METNLEKYIEEHFLLESGYLNMDIFLDINVPFIVIVGPRGIGKTYGVYQRSLIRNETIFSVRRKEKQYKLMVEKETSPLQDPYIDAGIDYDIEKVADGVSCAYINNDRKNVTVFFTYAANLVDLRGFSGRAFKTILYDEGVPEGKERKRKGEGLAILHGYETINRNRELNGLKPVKFILMCNYDTADADIFIQLKIVSELYRLKPGKCKYIEKRGLLIFNTGETPISKKKKETALYQLVGEGEFADVAIKNISPTQFAPCLVLPYKELKLKFNIGEISVFWWNRGKKYYVSHRHNKSASNYEVKTKGINRLKIMEKEFILNYALDNVVYENELLESVLSNYLET